MKSMMRRRGSVSRIVFLSALIILSINPARPEALSSGAEPSVLARVDVRGGLERVRLPIYASWLAPDESVTAIVIAPRSQIKASRENYWILDSPAEPKDYILAVRSRSGIHREGRTGGPLASLRILLDDGCRIVARASEDEAEALAVSGFEIARLPETPIVFRAAPENLAAAPLSIVPDPIVQEMMNEAMSTKTWTYDGNLSGEWPVTITGAGYTIATRHTRSGTPITQATQYVYEFMRDLGLQVAFQNWTSGSLSGRNVSGTKVGTMLPNEIVLLTAHIDDMPSSGPAPGADDNASGCAAVLMAAEIMSRRQFQRTVRFVFFTGEEQGLYGSAAYAGASSAAGENIVAVLNLDMIAWDKTGGPVVNLYLRQAANPGYASDLQIAETFAGVVAAYGLSAKISPKFIADGSGESDHASFWSKGYPAILLIEDDWYDFNSVYHTANDRLALLNTEFFASVTKAAVGTIAHLAALAANHTISGTATAGGIALPNVVMNGLPGTPVTNGSGYYSAFVDNGWSGTVIPFLAGYSFNPVSRSYTNVVANQGSQSYEAGLVPSPRIALSKASFKFGSERYGTPTPDETLIITNSGTGILSWTATPSADWISVLPGSGTGAGVMTIGISRTDMAPGYYAGTIAVTDPTASNSPRTVSIGLDVLPVGSDSQPFGNYATPADGATVSSSIPVTGWVLDDVGVQFVKIYRGTGLADRVFIGDAVFSKGARPDVEAAYPGYPQNDRAGWGYLLLTNFLPNGGNGPFTLLAYATDTGGHEVLLGSKAITCDNLHAVKPFGAIDTPGQGGTASGSAFINFGWALTPLPKSIPIDGSTITVWVDGLPLGHPTYNNYRPDIASLFPGYANSNGAVGYYYLNTTGYENKVHTIAWSVADSVGAVDGIGSRYFQIMNTGSGSALGGTRAPVSEMAGGIDAKIFGAADRTKKMISRTGDGKESMISGAASYGEDTESILTVGTRRLSAALLSTSGARSIAEIENLHTDLTSPVHIRRGYDFDRPAEPVFPNREGSRSVAISELERVAIYLDPAQAWETREELEARGCELRGTKNSSFLSSVPVANPRYSAFLLVGSELRPLPIGSTFDAERGVLYWQPGPGFLGDYEFIFLDSHRNTKKAVKIRIGTR
jgi:hypothetical protein